MRYVDSFRDPRIVEELLGQLGDRLTRPWTVMEVCGGQTHTLLREGIDQLLPERLELVHGPGCPVCVTPIDVIDQAHVLADRSEVILCSFGDMLRVPGSTGDLLHARAAGADVRIVYSPLDAVELAAATPDRFVVFFAVGFETTAPTTAMAVQHAERLALDNFAVLAAHVLVPPAMTAILGAADNRVQGFLAPGHVDTIMGWTRYEPIAQRFGVPIVVTGFEPVDLARGPGDAGHPTRRRNGARREPVHPVGDSSRERRRTARPRRGVRTMRSGVAGNRRASRQRPPAP